MVKVSVVIPIYNVENYLGACLDSIVNQTLKDIEIICINDGSKDNSLEVLKSYAEKDDRFTVIDQENGGHAVATNRGMDLATGKYLYLMDSDDVLEDPEALEKTYRVAEEKQVDFVLFQAINYNEEEKRYYKAENYSMEQVAECVGDKVFNYEDVGDLAFTITVTPWTKLYNRQFIVDCGARFPEGLIFEDNVFFWEVFFSAKRIYFLKEHLFTRRWHSASSTRAGDKRFLDSLAVTDLMIETFRKHDQINSIYAQKLFSKKISSNYFRFEGIKDELKELFFNEMQKNYREWVTDKEFYDCLQYIFTPKNGYILNAVLCSNNVDEFIAVMKNYETKKEHKKLLREKEKLETIEDKNIKLTEINTELKEKFNETKKLNDSLLNSNSWKVTAPLRTLRGRKEFYE